MDDKFGGEVQELRWHGGRRGSSWGRRLLIEVVQVCITHVDIPRDRQSPNTLSTGLESQQSETGETHEGGGEVAKTYRCGMVNRKSFETCAYLPFVKGSYVGS